MAERRRPNVWAPFYYFLVLIVGILLGYFFSGRSGSRNAFDIIVDRNDPLQEIISLIDDKYVDSINTDSLYTDAVNGILKHLDPHTIYIPASELAEVNEDLEGSFMGIGVEFYKLKDTVQITSVINGGPSEKAGILPGDKLIKVDDSLVSGISLSNDALIKKLRGIDKSSVKLSILRNGKKDLTDIAVTRGVIPLYSLDAAYMLDAKTGYIKLNRFSATTYEEFKKALSTLQKSGMQQLVLDLRQNPGGYLDAAIAIADEFLNGSKLLVYTQGRKSKKEEYNADRPGTMEDKRLVVMIDEGSASASEILAGAMQDWDRAVILGRQSFGKGLVQEQFDLSDGAALRLTIARYYTPTGRSIQRSYSQGREAYAENFIKRITDSTLADSVQITDTTVYYSEISHRKLYGGGGIMPDVLLPQNKLYHSVAFGFLLGTDALNTFVYDYYNRHSSELRQYKNLSDFDKNFVVDNDMMNEVRNLFVLENAAYAKEAWSSSESVSYLQNRIKAMLARMLYNNPGYVQITNEEDNAIRKALEIINSDVYQQILGKNSTGKK